MLKSLKISHLPESALLVSKTCCTTEDMKNIYNKATAHKHILSEKIIGKRKLATARQKKET